MKLPICLLFATALTVSAQTPTPSPTLTGRWQVTAELFGSPRYLSLNFDQKGNALTGEFTGDKLTGTVSGASVSFISKDTEGNTDAFTGKLEDGTLRGTCTEVDVTDPAHPLVFPMTATLIPPLEHPTPQRHDFTPTVFYRQFSPFNKPVLTVNPGDTIHTTTVDAGGSDEHSIQRVSGGNPETGPFYIKGANPGDTLVVHIVHLKLNRDWAASDDGIVPRGLGPDLAAKSKDLGKTVRWHIDLAAGTASPVNSGDHVKTFAIPLHPMLGCMATATPLAMAPPGTGDSGFYGGNMDFNQVAEGATIYLPVTNPGALLYFGDGHAAQGDGELNGNALETSMDVEVTVDVIPNKHIGDPRVETDDAIISMGLEGDLNEAFRSATGNMADWLTTDYKLTPSEVAQVIGSSAEYHVSEVADRNAGMILKMKKSTLETLTK